MTVEGTRSRILDATLAELATSGLARLSLETVAAAADVSRQTLYRYFGSREGLLSATILREEDDFIQSILDVVEPIHDLRVAIELTVIATLRTAAEHPLLNRLLQTEPESLLPYLTSTTGPVIPAARPILRRVIADRAPHLSDPQLDQVADTCTRLLVSWTANPPTDDPEGFASTFADLIVNGIKGTHA